MSPRKFAIAAAFMTALTVFITWPQAAHFGTAILDHDDPYFSIWRLSWIAHALNVAPRQLYDANIFYPEARTLAYSDAVLLEGATAAPLLWAGMSPVAAYNLEVFAAIALSGIGMLVLVHHLTQNDDASLLAGAVFVLLPYRIEHMMHMELQWAGWIPLSFWALHRTFEDRSIRFGMLTALFALLQLLSAVYYGVFLLFSLAIVGGGLALGARNLPARSALGLAVGALITTPVALIYMLPYAQNARMLGSRPVDEVARYSAVPLSYVSAPAGNAIWGWSAGWFRGNELHLFPGGVAILLAIAALLTDRRRLLWIYAVLCAFGVEMSFGLHGWLYPWLRDHLFVLGGFRAAARFSIIAFSALAVLAGLGFERIESRLTARWRRFPLLGILLVAIAAECASGLPPLVSPGSRTTPDTYLMLSRLPSRPLAEFPMPRPMAPPYYDAVYMFWSTRHWRPLINGYSGYVSKEYLSTLEEVAEFPDDRAIDRLASLGTGYVLVHDELYADEDRRRLLLAIARQPALKAIGDFRDWAGHARLFELRRAGPP